MKMKELIRSLLKKIMSQDERPNFKCKCDKTKYARETLLKSSWMMSFNTN